MDAAHCYNIVVHSVAYIAYQSWGILIHTITILLSTLQLMIFFLGTGFGGSDVSYRIQVTNYFK